MRPAAPLHEPDRGRVCRGHVPARQGRGAQRRLQSDLGAVLRFPAAILRRPAPTSSASRSRCSSTTSRCRGFGSQLLGHVCLLNLRDQDLSGLGRHQDQGLADLDHAADDLGQGPRGLHRLRPLGQRPDVRRQGRRPGPWPSARSPPWTPTTTASSPRRKRPRACCPPISRRIDANNDGFVTADETGRSMSGGPGTACCPTTSFRPWTASAPRKSA